MKKYLISIVLMASCLSQAADLDLAQHKGKVIYVDFWASWCGPCKESFPWLNQLAKKNPNLKIIGINLDKNKKDAESFLKEYPANFELIYDPIGLLAEKHKVLGMPYTIIFNVKGEKVHSHIGFKKDKVVEYEKVIKDLLESRP